MPIGVLSRLSSSEARASYYYGSMFLAVGVAVPFLPLWLRYKGFSDSDIGILNAVPVWTMVLINIFVGRLADKASDWRLVILFCSLIAGFAPFFLFATNDVWPIILVWTLCVLPVMALSPIIDAATVRMTRRRGSDFAMIRVWGTVGYVAANLVGGWYLGWAGIALFLPLFVGLSFLRGMVAFQLPAFRLKAPEDAQLNSQLSNAPPPHRLQAQEFKHMFRPWFVLAIIGSALIVASHGPLYTFGSLLWDEQGIGKEVIGPLWAIGSGAEVLIFLAFARIARRFSARHLMLFAAAMTSVRWFGMTLEMPVYGYFLLQMLHAFSFGVTYLGTLNFVANWTAEKFAAEAQSTVQVLGQGLLATLVFGFGFVYAQFGAAAFGLSAAIAAIGGLCVMGSLLLVNPRYEA
ncbi:MFS transporter [Maritalea sp.]|jgi:PPP family 3-phenylpropionic acid transporter|uniref:MFS transporter n=1 Tax=Maritalea sp. TaxID=2003361 RepID=UPI0039E6A29F